MAGDFGLDFNSDFSPTVRGTAAATLSLSGSASGSLGVTGLGAAFVAIIPEAIGAFGVSGTGAATVAIVAEGISKHGVSGEGIAFLSINADALGEHEGIIVVVPPVRPPARGGVAIRPVPIVHPRTVKIGKGEAEIRLAAKAFGSVGVSANGSVALKIVAEAEGEFFDAVAEDNQFILLLAA